MSYTCLRVLVLRNRDILIYIFSFAWGNLIGVTKCYPKHVRPRNEQQNARENVAVHYSEYVQLKWNKISYRTTIVPHISHVQMIFIHV
jgi:hypothetical protein